MNAVDLACLLIAPFVGSFLLLVADRLPDSRPILLARSACDGCGRRLGAAELIPLLSWTLQRARCRGCGVALSRRYPLVELAALALAVWAFVVLPEGEMPAAMLLAWPLLLLVLTDLDGFWLPDIVTLPLVLAGLAVTWATVPDLLGWHALAAAVGWASFRLIAWLYRSLRGIDGLGEGDAKLLAAGGAWVGLEGLPGIVLWAGTAGLLAALVMARLRGGLGWRDAIPFGPPLALGIWLVWLYGPVTLG